MAVIYDNWERLVGATLRREQLRISGLRTPSDLSSVSLSSTSPSFNFSSNSQQVSSLNFWSLLVGDSFTYHQILEATDYLSESNLIKHGHSGDIYYGVLEGGIQVVVKKISLSSIDRELQFRSELEICGMVYHSRLVPFLGYCLENVHEKFLVYKYTPNKDLLRKLQREIVSDTNGNHGLPSLDWTTRLKIATGAAEGLCYLHHECFPPLVHRDIQASSILLDDEFEVRLGSLTEVCIQEKDGKQNSITRFLRLPKGSVQSASSTQNASCAYDVYCFGKVLLELVSGKLCHSSVNDFTVKDWIGNSLRFVVPDNKKLVQKILEPSLLIDEHLLVEAWVVAFVAKACLSPKPSMRPQMAEILEALKYAKSARFNIGNVHPTGHSSSISSASSMVKVSEGSNIMGWILQATTDATSFGSSISSGNPAAGSENVYPTGKILAKPSSRIFTYSKLQKATRNFRVDALLGGDEFGRVYKGSLNEKSKSKSGSESLIAIKMFNSHTRMQTSQDWQSVVNLLGRLSHPNLVKFLGCCLENNEPLLVYELMQRGYLNNHLFARGSALQPLPWAVRLKVLIGAARGLAFLHASQRQGFFYQKQEREGFYYYFDPSKILLDDAYNAKISGFDVAMIGPPDIVYAADPIQYAWAKYVYSGPDYFAQGYCCLERDVYGFGVVLVQMLTGADISHPGFSRGLLLGSNASRMATAGKLEKVMDPRLEGKYPLEAAVKIALLAEKCLQYEPESRPSMKQVVDILETIELENPGRAKMNFTAGTASANVEQLS